MFIIEKPNVRQWINNHPQITRTSLHLATTLVVMVVAKKFFPIFTYAIGGFGISFMLTDLIMNTANKYIPKHVISFRERVFKTIYPYQPEYSIVLAISAIACSFFSHLYSCITGSILGISISIIYEFKSSLNTLGINND